MNEKSVLIRQFTGSALALTLSGLAFVMITAWYFLPETPKPGENYRTVVFAMIPEVFRLFCLRYYAKKQARGVVISLLLDLAVVMISIWTNNPNVLLLSFLQPFVLYFASGKPWIWEK